MGDREIKKPPRFVTRRFLLWEKDRRLRAGIIA
jgi:hypothetical protein